MNEKEDSKTTEKTLGKLLRKELEKAMFAEYLPCNPIPFLKGLMYGCKEEGTDYIQTDQAKRILFTIIQQAYGIAFILDIPNEFRRLKLTFKK
jgi:hypothetical protein